MIHIQKSPLLKSPSISRAKYLQVLGGEQHHKGGCDCDTTDKLKTRFFTDSKYCSLSSLNWQAHCSVSGKHQIQIVTVCLYIFFQIKMKFCEKQSCPVHNSNNHTSIFLQDHLHMADMRTSLSVTQNSENVTTEGLRYNKINVFTLPSRILREASSSDFLFHSGSLRW